MQVIERIPKIDGTIGWYELASNRDEVIGQPLTGDHTFDMVVIGAGFAGVAVAQRLLEIHRYLRIAVVDALKVGQGSSGRNAGFIIDTPHTLDPTTNDPDYHTMLKSLNLEAIDRLDHFRQKYNIECDWQRSGKYLAAHERRNRRPLRALRRQLEERGDAYEWLKGEQLARRLGTDYYRDAIYTEDTILMNPASLIRGIALGAKEEGITFFEESPIKRIEFDYPLHHLYGDHGSLSAPIVVNAANGYNMEFQSIENRLVPCFTYASLTDPLSDEDYEALFADVKPWGITSGHPMGTTVRFTADRRLFIRNTFEYEPKLQSQRRNFNRALRNHRKSFEARFPTLRHLPFQYSWGGMVTLTFNSEPMFADHNNGIYTIVGCNGVGITRGTYLGYYMANYIHKIDSKALDFILDHSHPTLIPPEPFKTVGAHARFFWEELYAGGDL